MANIGYGLQFSRTLHGGQPITKRYYVPSTDGTALFCGDVVRLTATGAMDPKGEVPTITRAATGVILLGVVEGFEVDSSQIVTGNSRPASTNRYVNVNIDPDSCYYAMQDDLGAALTQAEIGANLNVNIIVASGSTATGLSGTMIDSSTATASAADCKIIGIRQDSVNVGAAAACEVEVMILAPALKSTDSDS